MKKKIMSVIVMVAVLVTMLSTTVFAADSPTTAKQVKDSMQKAADWYAGKLVDSAPGTSAAAITAQAAYPLFLIERTGTKSENVTNLENVFLNAVKENVTTNNKIVNKDGNETIDTYANVIMTLFVMGKNPENFEGKDIVKMYSDYLESSHTTSVLFYNGSPYNIINIAAVDAYYKDKSEVIKEDLGKIDEAIILTYVKDKIEGADYISSGNASTYGVDLTIEGVSVDTSGSVHVTPSALEAINHSNSPYAGKFFTYEGYDYLDVNTTVYGPGFYNGGFGIDNDAKMVMGLLELPEKTKSYTTNDHVSITVNEVINASLTKISASIENDGLVDGWGYGTNSDSTGLALAAMSTYGKTAEAAKLCSGLLTLQNADGGFKYDAAGTYGTNSNLAATRDAIEGLAAYYYMLGEYGYMFDLSVNPTEAAETNEVQMTTPANATWVASNGDWFTVSSPLPLSELLDIQIDGKSVFGDYISTDENGVMIFAAIGGGTIRVWEGSTYVSFSPEFMATLGNGEHTVRIQSTTGFAEASFTVKAATPSTGDTANIAMYIAIAGVGAAVVTAAFVSKKRSSECE